MQGNVAARGAEWLRNYSAKKKFLKEKRKKTKGKRK